MSISKLSVLIVDDHSTYREILREAFAKFSDIDVVGSANDGRQAIEMARRLKPDLITLDVEMPVMDGIEALKQLRRDCPQSTVVMVSSLTAQGAAITIRAMQLGAFDFILKPASADHEANKISLRRGLRQIVSAYRSGRASSAAASTPPRGTDTPRLRRPAGKFSVLAIGASTGGPEALREVLGALPADLPVPVLIVQHMPETFTRALAESLNQQCSLSVCEASDGQLVQSGHVYVAPGGRHMGLARSGQVVTIRLSDAEKEHYCRPAVDYLFRSVAQAYGGNSLSVLLTGMGKDGAKGMAAMKELGGASIVQDEATSVVFGMPGEAVRMGVADQCLPLSRIAPTIAGAFKG